MDSQKDRTTGRATGSFLGKSENALMGPVVALDTERANLCEPLYKRLAGRLLTASRKAERSSGLGLPRPSPGETACRRVPGTGKPYKITFSNFAF